MNFDDDLRREGVTDMSNESNSDKKRLTAHNSRKGKNGVLKNSDVRPRDLSKLLLF